MLPNFALAAPPTPPTPTISSVTGTIANGNTLTINGANLLSEDNANWINKGGTSTTGPNFQGSAYGFQGASPTADGYCTGGDCNSGVNASNPCSYDSASVIIGSHNLKCSVSGYSAPYPNYIGSFVDFDLSKPDFYGRGYVKFTNNSGVWPNIAWKLFYGMGSGSVSAYWQPEVNGGAAPTSWGMISTINGINGVTQGLNPSGAIQSERWYLIEFKYSQSAHTCSLWVDNGTETTRGIDSTSQNYFELGIPNIQGTPAGFALDTRIAGFALSSSRLYGASTIEISGNCTDFPNCTGATWKYQPPTSLGETLSTVTADLPTKTATNYVLRVTNNQQQSVIFNLSGGGGGGDTTPPSAPSGLSVV